MQNSFSVPFTFLFFIISHSISFSQGTWTAKANFPGAARNTGVAFSIGAKGYFGTGFDGAYYQDFWEYDPSANTWTQLANFGGGLRGYAVGFSIGNFGYLGTGQDASAKYNDFWRYDPASNLWTQVANFGGAARSIACGFSIGNFGYVGTGDDGTMQKQDFWKYDPSTNSWQQQPNFPGGVRSDIDRAVFVIGNFAYWGTGANGWNDLWQFDPASNLWTQKTNFPGTNRYGATGFTICGKGFLGLGTDGSGSFFNNYWQYDPVSNAWSAVTSLPASGRCDAPALVVNNKAYLGTGYSMGNVFQKDWWEFSLGTGSIITISASSTTVCSGNPVTLTASGGTSYSWSNGSSASSIVVSPTSTTSYSSSDTSNSCSVQGNITITVLSQPSVSVSAATSICVGNSATLTASGGGLYSWNNGITTSSIIVSPSVTTSYSVSVTNACGTSTASSMVYVTTQPVAAISNCQDICPGGSLTLTAAGGNSFQWNTGDTISSTSVFNVGIYTVIVFSGNCSDTDTCVVGNAPLLSIDAGSNVTIASGSGTTLSASGGTNYSWNTGATTTIISVNPTVTTTYTVVAVEINGCSEIDTVTVFVVNFNSECPSGASFYVPNAFSPNDDGENDMLEIICSDVSCIKSYRMVIYNRWGEKVFDSENINEDWNGKHNGKIENTGVFVYYLKYELPDNFDPSTLIKKGNISLVR